MIDAERERPDFVIKDGLHKFGLEVCEVFTGPLSQSGSTMKKSESITQRKVNELRREFEAETNIPLTVKLVGDLNQENLATVVPAIIALDLETKPISYQTVIDDDNGLRVHVTKGFRVEWYSVNDRGGWVDRNPEKKIDEAIALKSKNLIQYQKAVGRDVRLLLVANRYNNSGKLQLERSPQFNLRGFTTVYFFSYPESILILDAS